MTKNEKQVTAELFGAIAQSIANYESECAAGGRTPDREGYTAWLWDRLAPMPYKGKLIGVLAMGYDIPSLHPIKTPAQALDYAERAYPTNQPSPIIIHLDKDGRPTATAGDFQAIIIIRKRAGDCRPTAEDIDKCEKSRGVAHSFGLSLWDNIIVADNGAYSFAEEHIITL